jgi:transaldolase
MHRDQDGCHAKSGLRQMAIVTSAIKQAMFTGIPAKRRLALLAAAVCGSGRRLYKQARMEGRCRAFTGHSVGRVALHLTLGPPAPLSKRLGVAVGEVRRYRDQLDSECWQRLANLGARAEPLLLVSIGNNDLSTADTGYVDGLAAPNMVDTVPRETLKATADDGSPAAVLPRNSGECAQIVSEFEKAGVEAGALAERLQVEDAKAVVQFWRELLQVIDAKSTTLRPHAVATAKRQP